MSKSEVIIEKANIPDVVIEKGNIPQSFISICTYIQV